MKSDSSQGKKVPLWFWLTGATAVILYAIGTIIDPARVMNNWKIAGAIVGVAGLVALYAMIIVQRKKG